MNRGIARRTVFEDRADVRYFLSHLARVVRAGWIEVHAYCVLTTHFHLLLKSSDAGISAAMGRVQNNYVRWFNRGRKRDGSLFRGRFRSRPIESIEDRRCVLAYIDANAVDAGLVPIAALYPHGSAQWYAGRNGPPWLERSWVEDELGAVPYDPARYFAQFGRPPSPALLRVVERRIESGLRGPDPLDDLLGAAPSRVLEWMQRKAALADGTRIDLPVCDPEDVRDLVAAERAAKPDWPLLLTRRRCDGWTLIEVALLRDLCGLSWPEIAARIGGSDSSALRGYRQHARALAEIAEYADASAHMAEQAITRCYGTRRTVPGTTSTLPSIAAADRGRGPSASAAATKVT